MDLSVQFRIHELLNLTFYGQVKELANNESDPMFPILYESFIQNLETNWTFFQYEKNLFSELFFTQNHQRARKYPREFAILMKLWGRKGNARAEKRLLGRLLTRQTDCFLIIIQNYYY
jgi:hypothetical protein